MSITVRSVRGLAWIGIALSGVAGVAAPEAARAQTTQPPPPAQQPGSATDIGKVSTGPGQEQGPAVTPSATTTRAAAVEEKKQAPNLIDVQPLSEIIKLPDVNIFSF